VVLAGGRSSRFGSDKLAARYRGQPLLQHAVTRVAEACGSVVLVVAPDADPPDLLPGLPVTVARDAEAYEGPLAGLAVALPHVPAPWAMVVAGDMPDLSPPVLLEMLRVAGEARVDAVALADGDRARPLPCVVRADTARTVVPALLRDGERRFRSLLDACRLAVIDEATWTALDPSRGTLRDVDVPADLGGAP
jgi:molybdopterin-guanine dinucleotide biosynthesis protein A